MKMSSFGPKVACFQLLLQCRYCTLAASSSSSSLLHSTLQSSSLTISPVSRYLAYMCILMIAIYQLWLANNNTDSIVTIFRSEITSYKNHSIRPAVLVPITTNDDGMMLIWPPMDMIHHIWDDISTNRNDKIHRRLVVVASNGQYADFAMNFAYSLIKQNVYNFVFVSLDEVAYSILYNQFPNHTLPIKDEFLTKYNTTTEAASYGSEEFKIVTSTRPMFLKPFLLNNITIFYNDIDMIWQHNAWDVIDQLQQRENQNQESSSSTPSSLPQSLNTDVSARRQYYDVMLWEDGPEQLCTCLIYMIPSNLSLFILDKWDEQIQTHKHYEDQRAFATVSDQLQLTDNTIYNNTIRIHINNEQFPTGGMYQWYQLESSEQNQKAIIIHNNWIVGKDAKKERFIHSNLWFVPP